MNDFASSLMVRLLTAGLAQSSLPPPGGDARVALADKRQLIAAVVAQRGRAALLEVGMGIHHLAGTPVYQALRSAATPHQFVQRWQRLERYLHSRHRIVVDTSGACSMSLTHCAPGHAQQPPPEESLLVLGVLIAGVQACGASALQVRCGELALVPPADLAGAAGVPSAVAAALDDASALSTWSLTWVPATPPQQQAAAQLQAVLDSATWPALARRIVVHLHADLAGSLAPGSVARSMGMSGRSLQRALASHGLTLSGLVAETRSRVAAWWLGHSDHPVAQIGFACGFADQAHFTRTFTRVVGLPPARYRHSLQP